MTNGTLSVNFILTVAIAEELYKPYRMSTRLHEWDLLACWCVPTCYNLWLLKRLKISFKTGQVSNDRLREHSEIIMG